MTIQQLIVTEAPRIVDVHVYHGADWKDPIPAFTLFEGSEDPEDMSGVRLELIARPSFDSPTRFILLNSGTETGILRDDPVLGLFSFFYPRANVEAELPLTRTSAGWAQFLTAFWTDPVLGPVSEHIWTGRMFVHPAKRAASI